MFHNTKIWSNCYTLFQYKGKQKIIGFTPWKLLEIEEEPNYLTYYRHIDNALQVHLETYKRGVNMISDVFALLSLVSWAFKWLTDSSTLCILLIKNTLYHMYNAR